MYTKKGFFITNLPIKENKIRHNKLNLKAKLVIQVLILNTMIYLTRSWKQIPFVFLSIKTTTGL